MVCALCYSPHSPSHTFRTPHLDQHSNWGVHKLWVAEKLQCIYCQNASGKWLDGGSEEYSIAAYELRVSEGVNTTNDNSPSRQGVDVCACICLHVNRYVESNRARWRQWGHFGALEIFGNHQYVCP